MSKRWSRLWAVLTRKQFSWLSLLGGIVAVLFAESYLWQTWAVIGGGYVLAYLPRVLGHRKRA